MSPAPQATSGAVTGVPTPPKGRIARNFSLKALHYEANAHIQVKLLKRLVPLIAACASGQKPWADLGCGSGVLQRLMAEARGPAPVFACLDLALDAVRCVRNGPVGYAVRGDMEALPFKPRSFEGAVTASVLQWLERPLTAIDRVSAILQDGGYWIFSIFVNDSFYELSETRKSLGLQVPVHCPASEEVTQAFTSKGFEVLEHELLQETVNFPDALSVLKNISATGAAVVPGKMLRRGDLAGFCEHYDRTFRTPEGVPLTWRALIGTARKRGQP
jgi:ubiquinone/menaquinone biosynthesis C-methylase UbiE